MVSLRHDTDEPIRSRISTRTRPFSPATPAAALNGLQNALILPQLDDIALDIALEHLLLHQHAARRVNDPRNLPGDLGLEPARAPDRAHVVDGKHPPQLAGVQQATATAGPFIVRLDVLGFDVLGVLRDTKWECAQKRAEEKREPVEKVEDRCSGHCGYGRTEVRGRDGKGGKGLRR